MREIKFRAWMNEWDEGGRMFYKIISLTPNFNEVQISLDGGNGYDGDFTVGKDVELMQYTGLKDKNGVEIYEGDIVKANNIHTVLWHDSTAGFYLKNTKGAGALIEESNLMEVIGNIYENSELLNGNKE